jgi:tyrosine-protein phosphatase 2/3
MRRRLCWEQNVHVIVMLTREVEGLTVKCGAYWVEDVGREQTFGPLTLKLVSKVGLPGDVDLRQEQRGPQTQVASVGDSFFGSAIPLTTPHFSSHPLLTAHRHQRKPITTIKRTFELSHSRYPHLGARKVVQLQYLEWPDMNVPDDARGVLGLVKEVEKAVDETWDGRGAMRDSLVDTELVNPTKNLDEQSGISKHALGGKERRPVLLHCSAGVGRTGGFIAVDAVLDAVRREVRKGKGQQGGVEHLMDVDEDVIQGVDVTGMMTVPIPVSAGGEGQKANVGASAGLIMHVPAVVVPENMGGDVPRTPMQVDGDGKQSHVGDKGPSSSTREWAQDVLDQTGGSSAPLPASSFAAASGHSPASGIAPIAALVSHHNLHPRPPFKSTSSSSSLPTDSDDPGSLGIRRMAKVSSSLGTSVSGSSEEGKLVGPVKRTESPLGMDNETVSEEGENVKKGHGMGQQQQRRPRTLSAPHTHLKSMSAVGPSPLASSSTSRRDRMQMASLAEAGIISLSSDDGPPPSQAMTSTVDENETTSSLPPEAHPRSPPDPHRVLSKPSPPLPHPSSSPEQTPDRLVEEPRARVDYKEPRQLHDLNSPVLLSSFEEPIWEVVQDMREQRMSLCQSLRQYVFVHAAIIEGALMVVDEERKRERETEAGSGMSATVGTKSHSGFGVRSASSSPPNGDRPMPSVTFAPPPVLVPPIIRPSLTMFTNASEVSMTSMSTGKRGASPTELLKEGKKGEVLLSKRPSIKRQSRPSERGMNSDQRVVAFHHKQSQGLNYFQAGQGAGSVSAAGLHLQLEMVSSSPSSSSSLS